MLLIDSSAPVARCEQYTKKNVSSWYFYFSKGRHNSLAAWPLLGEFQTSPGSCFGVMSAPFSMYGLLELVFKLLRTVSCEFLYMEFHLCGINNWK